MADLLAKARKFSRDRRAKEVVELKRRVDKRKAQRQAKIKAAKYKYLARKARGKSTVKQLKDAKFSKGAYLKAIDNPYS